ncbi:MAG TPA: hypothetical protein VFQ53_30070 [Kofleriaceae bacterium]|nr:hypothetical protein [Kofleriaceae bacterium]
MARLGELLIATGLLTAEQLEQALRAQVMWGGRLGTNLIELGFLDLDSLSTVLGKQHKLPAALARHFDRADRELQSKLSPDVAERFSCVPLFRVGAKQMVVLATQAPLDDRAMAIIADELGCQSEQLIPSIAAELRIRYHLERVYKIPRGTRFLRSRGKTIPPFPQFTNLPGASEDSQVEALPPPSAASLQPKPKPQLVLVEDGEDGEAHAAPSVLATAKDSEPIELARVDHSTLPPRFEEPVDISGLVLGTTDQTEAAPRRTGTTKPPVAPPPLDDDSEYPSIEMIADDDLSVPQAIDPVDDVTGRERRRYVHSIGDEPSTESERQTVGRIAIRKVGTQGIPVIGTNTTLGEATRAIRRSLERDKVGDLVVLALERFVPVCEAALLLVIRGELAIGWKGFARSGHAIPEIGVPLEQPGMIPRVLHHGATLRTPSSELGPIDQLILVSLGRTGGELVVVPVTIGGQVMCVIAIATEPDADLTSAESIAVAAGAAFARMMRDASR